MPYKDKGKANEASKERMRRYRLLHPAVTPAEDVTPSVSVTPVTPSRDVTPLPNCPDGRYRPFSKEEQLSVKMSKKQAKKLIAFDELKTKYDIRLIND